MPSKILQWKKNQSDTLYNNIIEYPKVTSFKEEILNETINDIKRRGKWLVFVLDNYYLLSHLRMEGKYNIRGKDEEITKYEHVIFYLDDNTSLRYDILSDIDNDENAYKVKDEYSKKQLKEKIEKLGYTCK